MGCNTSSIKQIHEASKINKLANTKCNKDYNNITQQKDKSSNSVCNEQSSSIKIQIKEIIKKRDIFLFKRIIEKYAIKPNENLNQVDDPWTILHEIAKRNFCDGMRYVLDEITQINNSELAFKLVNIQDFGGNTPAMICCFYKAVETLELLLRYDYAIDYYIKNFGGKTLYDIALERGSYFADLIEAAPKVKLSLGNDSGLGTTNTLSEKIEAGKPSKFNKKLYIKNTLNHKFQDAEGSIVTGEEGMPTNFITLESRSPSKHYKSLGTFNLAKIYISKPDPQKRIHGILSEHELTKGHFEDIDFDTEQALTLGLDTKYIKILNQVTWIDIENIIKNPNDKLEFLNEFNDFFLNKLINQESNLYLVLKCLSEYPSRLIKIFNNKEYNSIGAYSITLNKNGIETEVIIDSKFPLYNKVDPFFLNIKKNDIWPLILEKGMAKLYGSYQLIHKHLSTDELVESILSMPTYITYLKNFEINELWDNLIDYDANNYIIIIGKLKNKDDIKSISHLFLLINLYECEGHRLVKLKNNSENYSWKGDFSDDSKLWNNYIKSRTGYIKNDKNNIFMRIEDLQNNFDFICVCHYHEEWNKTYIDVLNDRNCANYFEFIVEKDTETYIQVHQPSIHIVTNDNSEYAPIDFKIVKKLDDTFSIIGLSEIDGLFGKRVIHLHNKTSIFLEEGSYIIRVKGEFKNKQNNKYSLSMMSKHGILVKENDPMQFKNFLQNYYLSYSNKFADDKKYYMGNSCELCSGWCDMHLWIVLSNGSNQIWNVEILFNTLENIKLSKFYKKTDNSFYVQINPKSKIVTYAKRIDPNKLAKFIWEFKTSWSSQLS